MFLKIWCLNSLPCVFRREVSGPNKLFWVLVFFRVFSKKLSCHTQKRMFGVILLTVCLYADVFLIFEFGFYFSAKSFIIGINEFWNRLPIWYIVIWADHLHQSPEPFMLGKTFGKFILVNHEDNWFSYFFRL